jgi:hypothetical protein
MAAQLFTFEDQSTGELIDTIAPNEAVARLKLGLDDIERAPLWCPPSEIADMSKVLQEAQEAERAAFDSKLEATPPVGAMTTPAALKKFADAQERHRKAKARVQSLIKLGR